METRTQEQINQEVFNRLKNIESLIFSQSAAYKPTSKLITLAELVRDKEFKNGQEKVAAIVGYYEIELGKTSITNSDVQQGWRQAKFNGNYAPELMKRAVKDGLVNDYDAKGNFVLTQSGEKFYNELTK